MNEFMEKWKMDSKFKAKVQLGFYGIFILFAVILAFVSNSSMKTDNHNEKDSLMTTIEIPENYQYTININLNGSIYTYTGNITPEEEIIVKTVNEEKYNYIKKRDTYYKDIAVINNIVSREEVYDIIDYSYLNLKTINQYLSVSKKSDNQYMVYLKDIILGHDSGNYIIIKKEDNKLNINYTTLLQLYDKTIENCNVEYIINEME